MTETASKAVANRTATANLVLVDIFIFLRCNKGGWFRSFYCYIALEKGYIIHTLRKQSQALHNRKPPRFLSGWLQTEGLLVNRIRAQV